MALHASLAEVRKRPGMYLGGPPPWARRCALREILSNSFDQWLAGRARRIGVDEPDERTFVVEDDGPGIALLTLRTSVTAIHDRPTLDGHRPHAHLGGPRGMGIAIVAALCETFEIETSDGHVRTRWSLSAGEPIGEPHSVADDGPSGTRIRAVLDSTIWKGPCAAVAPPPSLDSEAERLADLAPGLEIGSGDRWFRSGGLVERARRLGASAQHPLLDRDVTLDGTRYRVVVGWRDDGGPPIEELAGNYRLARTEQNNGWIESALGAYARSVGLGPAWRIADRRVALCAIEDASLQWGTPTGDVIVDRSHRRRVAKIVREMLEARCAHAPADVLAFTRVVP